MEIATPISIATLSSDINGAGTRGPATKFRSRWRRLTFAPPVTGQSRPLQGFSDVFVSTSIYSSLETDNVLKGGIVV